MLTVEHKEHGRGVAICFHEMDGKTFLVVDFGGKKEMFRYPHAFADELRACDETIARSIAEELEQVQNA